jgi:hypothetical protein
MMNDQTAPRSAGATAEPITLKNRFTQTAEPAPRVVLAVVAKAAAAQTFHFNGPPSTHAQQVQLSGCPLILQPRPQHKGLPSQVATVMDDSDTGCRDRRDRWQPHRSAHGLARSPYSQLLPTSRPRPPCVAPCRDSLRPTFDQAALAAIFAIGPLLGRAAHATA